MKAIILAAGKATRLLPLTKDTPQCLLKVGEKTILELQIQTLKKAGIEEIIVVTGHLSDKVERFCDQKKVKFLYNPFYEVSGMAASLWVAKQEMKDDFIFLYSDILFEATTLEELIKKQTDICLAIKKNGLRDEAEKVTEKDDLITNIGKAKTEKDNGEFIGLAKFSKSGSEKLIKILDKKVKQNLNTTFIELISELINKEEVVNSCDIKNSNFIDIDFPEQIEEAKKIFNETIS